jgi:sensor histidine kinase YesM
MKLPNIQEQKLWMTALGNTAIAGIIWLLGMRQHFGDIFIVAQCIGLSCLLVSALLRRLWPDLRSSLRLLLLTSLLGLPLGAGLASLAGLPFLGNTAAAMLDGAWRYLLICVAVSLVFHAHYRNQARLQNLEAQQREAELREMSVQKEAVRAQLRALQAQIEPHFLFNTLANLHSLIGRDAEAARSLLEKLNDYLRATLAHSRAEHATLGNEAAMLSAYLAIQTQRMGSRLDWAIDIPAELQQQAFPPMLLQPLVENAIAHGLEPKLGAGRLRIRARNSGGMLQLAVCDDGIGFAHAPGSGTGLANVRERLTALFGDAARLELKTNAPSGVQAELWIPLPASAP